MDGYSSCFFKKAWPVIGHEVSEAICDFFKKGKLLKKVNATLITLIPKVDVPETVAEFRPISCCGVLYKIITKNVSQILNKVLGFLVGPEQAAFVKGRNIFDNIMVAHELVKHYSRKNISPRAMLKIDIRKSYDSIK